MPTRILLHLIALSIAIPVSLADARVWELEGKSIEADSLASRAKSSVCRRAKDSLTATTAAYSGERDRRFVLEWADAQAKQSLSDEVKVEARTGWESVQVLAKPGEQPHEARMLGVIVAVRGKQPSTASTYGKLEMGEVVADDGTVLLSNEGLALINRWNAIDRYGSLGQPSWGFQFTLQWHAPARRIRSLRRLRGAPHDDYWNTTHNHYRSNRPSRQSKSP